MLGAEAATQGSGWGKTVTLTGGTDGIRTRSSRGVVLAAGLLLAGCHGAPSATTGHPGSAPAVGSTAAAGPARAAAGSCHVLDGRADVRCTPGATNPDVTQATIGRTLTS